MPFSRNYELNVVKNNNDSRTRKVQAARNRILRLFEDDPSCFTVDSLEPDKISLIKKRVRVINESVLRQLNPERVYSKYVIPHPQEKMISGTILYGLYEADWLVTAVTNLGDVHEQATLQKLNETITWKDSSGKICSVLAVVNGVSRVGDGVEFDNLITTPDELAKIKIQATTLTNSIKRSTELRIGNKIYSVTKIDSFTDDNILNIIAKEEQLGPIDNFIELTINPGEISGVDSITRTRNYTFTAPVGVTEWRVVGNEEANIKIISFSDTEATIRADYTILGPFVLEAHYSDGSIITKNLRLVSLF